MRPAQWPIGGVLAGIVLASLLCGCPRPPAPDPQPTPAPTPVPVPTPPPPPYVPNKRLETGRIFNGMKYQVTLETDYGTTATADRNEPSSYVAELKVKVKVPKPHKSLAGITRLNENLPALLPELPSLLESARVSPFFDDLYRLKVANLRENLNRLDNLLSRHNFFDTETVLEFQNPKSKRKALFVQSDMDVDEDGSDSDRVPSVDGSSVTFQPFTSYRWNKRTGTPNSFGAYRETKIKQYEDEIGRPGLANGRASELRDRISLFKRDVVDLKRFSFLVASVDPYIVLPGSMFGKSKGAFAPSVGDYCVVVYGGTLYPAIVGDVGPAYKSGEGSLRLCKQLNSAASANNRPVNDLKVSYLIFPGSGDKPWEVPDLAKWHQRCESLLQEIGGYTGELFTWDDLTKPKPAPATPVPTPLVPPPPPPPKPTPTPPTAAPIQAVQS